MHDHDYAEPFDVEVDEVVVVYQRCQHREVYGEHYSERHDEVFYDEGERCDATQVTYYELDEVVWNGQHGSHVVDIDNWFESDERQAEQAFMAAERELDKRPPTEFDPGFSDEISVTVDVESEIFDVTDSFTFVYTKYETEEYW